MIVLSIKTGRTNISLARARELFQKQLSFYWEQQPLDALLFPYFEFDMQTYAEAAEMTFLMIAFLIGHEMAHLYVPVTNVAKTHFAGVKENAQDFLASIPPPFLLKAPHANWQAFWIEELLCDALSAMSIFLVARTSGIALERAPQLGERSQRVRYEAMEAVTLHMEALYRHHLFATGNPEAVLSTLFTATHPLPNLRRVFLRGWAEQVDPSYITSARAYETALKSIASIPGWA